MVDYKSHRPLVSVDCQRSDWAVHHATCQAIVQKKIPSAAAKTRADEPLLLLGSLRPSEKLDPVEAIALELPALRATQGGRAVGVLVSPAQLSALPARLCRSVLLTPAGSRQSDCVPVEIAVQLHGSVPGLAAAIDICFNGVRPDPVALTERSMSERIDAVVRMRAFVLRDVMEPHTPHAPAPRSVWPAGATVPAAAVGLCIRHLSLRDVCRAVRVCKAWRAAIDGNGVFWNALVWWDVGTFLPCAESQLAERLENDFGKWMALVEHSNGLSVRQQMLQVLGMANCCHSCGIVLQGRHLSKSLKTGAVVREIAELSHLGRLCGDCANEFVVPQQAARTAFPELGRTEYMQVFAFKLDNRKCLLLGQLRERRRVKRAELLEAEAAAQGLTAQQLWEAANVPSALVKLAEKPAGLKARYVVEEDEEDRAQREADAAAAKKLAELEARTVWVPVELVFEQAGEEWAADSHQTVARRNLELLQQLNLVQITKREEQRVGFVETLDVPFSEAAGRMLLARQTGKKPARRRSEDDEDDYEEEKSSSSAVADDGSDNSEVGRGDSPAPRKSSSGAAAATASAAAGKGKKGGRRRDEDDDFIDDDEEETRGRGRKGSKKGGASPRSKSGGRANGRAAKKGAKGKRGEEAGAVSKPARPALFDSFAKMIHDDDLLAFLTKFGFQAARREQPGYKVCVALFESAKKDDDDFLQFRKDDEIAIGFWMEKKGWSIGYLLREPYDYAGQRRAWGFLPNNYVKVIDYWTPSEIKAVKQERQ